MPHRLFIILGTVSAMAIACGEDDPGFESAEGKWTYNTPDGKIGVDFELINGPMGWEVVNQEIRVDGVTYNAEIQVTGINPPTLQFIRINANDSKAVYGYNIVLNDGTLNGINTLIVVPAATYTWPHDKTNTLKDISISRK